MPFARALPALAVILATSAAFAHSGVQNPAVKARMEAMKAIADDVKSLTRMSRGELDFDSEAAASALDRIATRAGNVPLRFEARETDPKSEAAAAIWSNWDDFTARAQALDVAAQSAMGIDSPEALGAAMRGIAGTCKACHERYKL